MLNLAGDGAQFARSRCSISGGILTKKWKVAAFYLIISFSTGERTAVHRCSATYKNRKRFVRIGMDLLDI